LTTSAPSTVSMIRSGLMTTTSSHLSTGTIRGRLGDSPLGGGGASNLHSFQRIDRVDWSRLHTRKMDMGGAYART
jgi:hypothetical protein